MRFLLSYLVLIVAICAPAFSQLIVSLEPVKKQFVAGEPVNMRITVSNNTGQTMQLVSNGSVSWLDIHVENTNGDMPLPQSRIATFPPLTVPAGKSVSRRIDLRHFYDLSRDGQYKAIALVRGSDMRTLYSSRGMFFSVQSGMPMWSQTAAPRNGKRCKYAVRSMTEQNKNRLYVQIKDDTTGIPIHAVAVGEWMSFYKPMCKVDSQGRCHVLFMTTPTIYVWATVTSNGDRLPLKYLKKIAGNQPSLIYLPDGSIRAVGAVVFNPFAKPSKPVRDASVVPN